MTGKNPNVFYEVGYAHAKGKFCILLTSNVEDIPFDLKHQRHIVYGTSITGLKSKLTVDLAAIKVELDARENPISVELGKLGGDLIRTKYSATAKVEIYLDLHNRSPDNSPDIEAIYFYMGKAWSFRQDNQECAQTKSDLEEFHLRHLIRSPVRRLTKDGWAQVKLVGEKLMGYSWQGKELQDSYQLTGRALVRVLSARETYEYPLSLEVEVSYLPF